MRDADSEDVHERVAAGRTNPNLMTTFRALPRGLSANARDALFDSLLPSLARRFRRHPATSVPVVPQSCPVARRAGRGPWAAWSGAGGRERHAKRPPEAERAVAWRRACARVVWPACNAQLLIRSFIVRTLYLSCIFHNIIFHVSRKYAARYSQSCSASKVSCRSVHASRKMLTKNARGGKGDETRHLVASYGAPLTKGVRENKHACTYETR